MSKFIVFLVVLLASIGAASAQTIDISAAPYNAKCDGSSDDAPAINLATAALRTATQFGATGKITGPFGKRCRIMSTIDLTRLTHGPVIVELPFLICQTNGTPCVDASGSKFMHWRDLAIQGTSTLSPNIGLQVARTSTASGNEHVADHMFIQGYYTFAALYNESVEVSQWNHVILLNQLVSPSSFTLVMDGANHWNAQSAFTTIGLAVDSQNSFNDNTFISASIQHVGGGIPIWMSATAGHRYYGSYVQSIGGPACVMLYDNGHGENKDTKFDHLHCESSPVPDLFLLSGTNASPLLRGFIFDDFSPQSRNSIFKLDVGVTSATIDNPQIRIENTIFGLIKLFDNPSAWTLHGGYIWLPSDAYWSGSPAVSTGCVATPQSYCTLH